MYADKSKMKKGERFLVIIFLHPDLARAPDQEREPTFHVWDEKTLRRKVLKGLYDNPMTFVHVEKLETFISHS